MISLHKVPKNNTCRKNLLCLRKRKHPNVINETMKELNYKIKKGHVSYLWRGEGKRLYKAIFKKSWFININNSVLLVPNIR